MFCIDGNTNVAVLLQNDVLQTWVNTRVELRKRFQRRGDNFESNRDDRQFAAGSLGFFRKRRSGLFEFGDVCGIELCDVRNRTPGFLNVLRGFSANGRHWPSLGVAPMREVG